MIHEAKHRDKVVIPDRYNTGIKIPQSALTPINNIISSWSGYIEPSNVSRIFDDNYVCNGVSFVGTVAFKSSVAHGVTFKNCKFDANNATYCMSLSGSWSDNLYWHFENCEFVNFGSASVQTHDNLVFKNCQFHHGNADGIKGGFSNGGYENCLIYDCGRGEGDVHADGLQTTGYQKDFYVKNCRFDLPTTAENKSNACIFYTQEQDAIDCVVEDVMMFGGGYTFYLGIKDGHEATITNLQGNNIKIGYGEHYGIFNCNLEGYSDWRTDGTLTRQDKLFVSSVQNASDGSVKIHATNYTNEDRTLVVVTDVDTYTFTVEGNLSWEDGHTLTWEDYHFDDEFTVYGNYVICYDTSVADANEIRFAQTSVAELFTEIGNAIRAKKGESDLYARVALPYEISTIQGGVSPSGTIEITSNGTYDVSAYASAKVDIEAFHLSSISATKTVTEYSVDDDLDLTDISVVASYSNESTKDVSDSESVVIDDSDVDMSTEGEYTISVSYTEDGVTVTTSITITVTDTSVVYPEYDQSVYPYFALIQGYPHGSSDLWQDTTQQGYVFAASATQRTPQQSQGILKFTGSSSYGKAKMWYSTDGRNWTPSYDAPTATLDTRLAYSTYEFIEETIVRDTTV